VDQERHVTALLERHGMANCNPTATPLSPGTELRKDDDDLLPEDEASTFREVVGSLLYLTVCSRPDVGIATNQLSRFMAKPAKVHMTAAKHVLRYLKGTASLGLTYRRPARVEQRSILTGYADASFMSVPDSSRSVTGYTFLLNGAAVSWRSKVQSMTSLSTTESEFDALCGAVRECAYLRGLLEEMGKAQHQATTMLEDSQPCIALIKNPVNSSRTRHVALRFNFVREKQAAKVIDIVYCPTDEMLADMFTKVLPRPQFSKLRSIVMGM
jgi:hypothetical protein